MFGIDDWTQYILGGALLIIMKLALLHYTLKFANWWKGRSKEVTKKCRNIYEYNFLDEYESETDAQPDYRDFKVGKSNAGNGQPSQSGEGRHLTLQTAAKNLLTSIRNRRERTAAAMLNASLLTTGDNTETETTSGSNFGVSDRRSKDRCQNAQEFLQSSKYYAFLQDILKEKNS